MLESHGGRSTVNHFEPFSGRARQINDPTMCVRSAIVDANNHGAAVRGIYYPETCAERERAVGCGHRLRIEDLAVRRRSSFETKAIEACLTFGAEIRSLIGSSQG